MKNWTIPYVGPAGLEVLVLNLAAIIGAAVVLPFIANIIWEILQLIPDIFYAAILLFCVGVFFWKIISVF